MAGSGDTRQQTAAVSGRAYTLPSRLTRTDIRSRAPAGQAAISDIRLAQDFLFCEGATHVKFAASSMLPAPLYLATCGYGHNGRARSTFPAVMCDAASVSGAFP